MLHGSRSPVHTKLVGPTVRHPRERRESPSAEDDEPAPLPDFDPMDIDEILDLGSPQGRADVRREERLVLGVGGVAIQPCVD